jgi:hypothetical protein
MTLILNYFDINNNGNLAGCIDVQCQNVPVCVVLFTCMNLGLRFDKFCKVIECLQPNA